MAFLLLNVGDEYGKNNEIKGSVLFLARLGQRVK